MTTSDEIITLDAELDPKALPYLFWIVCGIMAITVVGIPFIPFFAIFYHAWYKGRYFEHHSMRLTERTVEIHSGVVFRRHTNLPYDRITDVSVEQGPFMRRYGIHKVTVETAGQTQMQGTASMVGVIDPDAFRQAVLNNVEVLKSGAAAVAPQAAGGVGSAAMAGSATVLSLLTEIRDSLRRMEGKG